MKMYSKMLEIINQSDSRYLTREEQQRILAYTNSIPKRFEVANQVQENEERIVEYAIERMKRDYPRFNKLHDQAWDKAFRDMQLVIRYVVQGLILDDVTVGEEKLFVWFRTILGAVGMTPQFVRDCYGYVRDACQQQLPAESFGMLEPHLDRAIEVLSDFPEPFVPLVN